MALIRFEDVSFAYPKSKRRVLDRVSFSMEEGEYIVVCGASGCGKTTLLKQIKRELTPAGAKEGQVFFREQAIDELDAEVSAMKIGFVQQNPDAQIVTDVVFRELAFGLENQAMPSEMIRRRVSEIASFFGMESWFRRKTIDLSGGQKQMLNLASILAMNPDVLVLDEPTSMLDPLASKEFLDMIYRVNRELGVAVVLCEHQLEDVFPIADRILLMDRGQIERYDTPKEMAAYIGASKGARIYRGLPSAVQIFGSLQHEGLLDQDMEIPLQIRDARKMIKEMDISVDYLKEFDENHGRKIYDKKDRVIKGKEIWFRYQKDSPDILRSLDVELYAGEILSLVGGNGSGKSTLLKNLTGIISPYRGSIKREKDLRIAMLPQSPQAVFTHEQLIEDLVDAAKIGYPDGDLRELAAKQAELFGLGDKLEAHPFDLSGGEIQRAAIAKLMLTNAKILLLDEPTKGLDAYLKETLQEILKRLASDGVAILMVTHDLSFAAEVSDNVAMLFDGRIISRDEAHHFFAGNRFYTTAANQIAGAQISGAISVMEVVECLKRRLPEKNA